ncbi:hypothetical protein Tco_1154414 [Tanacetum coccineum]
MGIAKEETCWRRESAASMVTVIDDWISNTSNDGRDMLGKTLDESLLVRKLLDSTPDRFIQIVASIEQTNDLDDITLDEIIGKLKAFEERIKISKGGQ